MSRTLTLTLCVVFAPAPVGGLLPAAPVPRHLMPKDDLLYFPTAVGARWVYTDGAAYEVTRVEDAGGGKVVTVTGAAGGETRWQVSPAGLFILSMGEQVCDPPTPMLRLPLAEYKTWETQQQGGAGLKGLFTAGGAEDVEVKAGRFRALRVEGQWVGNNRYTEWYAPGVGPVKSVNGARGELRSFTPGKN